MEVFGSKFKRQSSAEWVLIAGDPICRRMLKSAMASSPPDDIAASILVLRGQKVLLDGDLARLYGVQTKVLVQAVKRNSARFPPDFMFQLRSPEWNALRSQFVTSKPSRGGRRYAPYAFTEQGVAMLSSVVGSARAIAVNIEIMRAFVRMRAMLASNQELAKRIDELDARLGRRLATHDEAIAEILAAIRELMQAPAPTSRGIGFTAEID